MVGRHRRPDVGGLGRIALDLVLLFVGTALASIALTNSIRFYVIPGMRWPVLATAILLALLAVADMAVAVTMRRARRHVGAGIDHSHAHGHAPSRLPWLLVLPAALLLFVVPAPIGASGAGEYSPAGGAGRAAGLSALPAGDAPEISLVDLYLRAEDPEDTSLRGREFTVTGQLLPDDAGRTRIGRVVITCCAADATTISAHLDPASGETLAGIPGDAWVSAVATAVPREPDADFDGPVIHLVSATPIAPPASPYAAPR